MAAEVKVPELAESISEASLLSWSKASGDSVSEGEIVAAVETDKIVLDVPAPAAGVLEIIVTEPATPVESGQVLGRISPGVAGAEAPAPAAAPPKAPAAAQGGAVDIKVPELAESISEASLLEWRVKPGDSVARDQIVVSVETDKIVLDILAPQDGVVTEILKDSKAQVESMELIARLAPGASAGAPAPAEPASPAAPPGSDALVMPSARKLAAEKGVPLSGIEGHGKDGRITKEDVKAAGPASKPAAAAPAPAATPAPAPARSAPPLPPPAAGAREERRVKMTRLRAKVAERLLDSQRSAAILSTFNEVNMQPVMDVRKTYRDEFEKEWGVRLGFMSFFVKAAVRALKKYPVVNASVEGDDIIYHEYYDVGIAVSSPRGLVVPILRDADSMTFADVERQISEYGARAKEGKLTLEDITGGTFSISNGGVFGSMLSTPIVNPPQSAILGVHATKERPVAENGQVVVRPMNYLALSYDHRIIDGREAVQFLVSIKEALEDPLRLLIDV